VPRPNSAALAAEVIESKNGRRGETGRGIRPLFSAGTKGTESGVKERQIQRPFHPGVRLLRTKCGFDAVFGGHRSRSYCRFMIPPSTRRADYAFARDRKRVAKSVNLTKCRSWRLIRERRIATS
jgi:hypothetical protein